MDWVVGRDEQATHINAMAIISDLEQLQATVFDKNLEGSSSRVDGIFDELL